MRRIYIAHPLTSYGNLERNIQNVHRICKEIAAAESEGVPISPIHAFSFMPREGSQKQVLEYCKSLMVLCDEVRFFGAWWLSEGCIQELMFAKEKNIRVIFKTSPFEQVI